MMLMNMVIMVCWRECSVWVQVTAKDKFQCVVWCLSLCVCIMVLKNAVYVWTQTLTKSSNSPKKLSISRYWKCSVYVSQKFSKGAETCPNFKNNWEDAVPVQGQCLSGTLTCRPCLLLDMTLTGNLGSYMFCSFLWRYYIRRRVSFWWQTKKNHSIRCLCRILMLWNAEFPCKVLQCSNMALLQNFVSYLADFLQDSQGFWPHSCMILHFISCKPLQNFSSCNKNLARC